MNLYGYFRYGDAYERRQRAGRLRAERMAAARLKGSHRKEHWKILHDIFNRCVSCGVPYSEFIGNGATKDHIEPVVIGGCDCIGNLQPACRQCNSAGINVDLRSDALPGWQTIYLHKLGAYF